MANKQITNKTQRAKTLGQQLAAEPLEILKAARESIAPTTLPQAEADPSASGPHPEAPETDKSETDLRRIEALNREIEDIQKEKLYQELLKKIESGEDLFVDGYANLSMEQRQVLKAHQESVQKQKLISQQQATAVPQITSKPGRRFGAGIKGHLQKAQTQTERVQPPSG